MSDKYLDRMFWLATGLLGLAALILLVGVLVLTH